MVYYTSMKHETNCIDYDCVLKYTRIEMDDEINIDLIRCFVLNISFDQVLVNLEDFLRIFPI